MVSTILALKHRNPRRIHGVARFGAFDHSVLSHQIPGGDFSSSKLVQKLIEHGFEHGDFFQGIYTVEDERSTCNLKYTIFSHNKKVYVIRWFKSVIPIITEVFDNDQ